MKDMLKQGPMTKNEAEQLVRRYKEKGVAAIITNGFEAQKDGAIQEFFVFAPLPKRSTAPRQSRTYQNPLWG
jgi:hypothetical protein